ncbi:hypothetical protein B7P43_G04558 [Cryptotermes secundus]|uniref:Ionotropic glutamate receptor C-terminal domain-containing protein n=1 Tax=Cryptotermes secundus TaxID=105785 RepID=A0A2J7QLL5_9NEOP|nr:hypothetical protein B7P43_G04558 [Cryptotermes secundus]
MSVLFAYVIIWKLVQATLWSGPRECHMVNRLRIISERHFPVGLALAVSLPESQASQDIESAIADVIQDRAVVVFHSHNNSKPLEVRDKFGSYIIMISDDNHDEEQVSRRVYAQLKHLSRSSSWNPRARFVVACFNPSLSDTELLARRILQELWKWYIVNVVVLLSQKPGDKGMLVSDERRSGFTFLQAYTWFPYQSPSHCTQIDNITVLNSWSVMENDSFAEISNLFPSKIRNLNGCPLLISARVMEPLVMKAKNISRRGFHQTELVYVDGIEIKLVDFIVKATNAIETYVGPENPHRVLYLDLLKKTTDIAVGATILRREYTTVAEPTVVFDSSRLRWYVPCSVKVPHWMSILKMFAPSLWFAIFSSIILAVIISYCLAKLRGDPVSLGEHQTYSKVSSACSTVCAVILGMPVYVQPLTDPLRTFFFSWVCYSLAVNTVFQAFLTTLLIDPGYERQISSMEELFNSDLTFLIYEGHIPFYEVSGDWKSTRIHNNHRKCHRYTCVDEMMTVARSRNSAVLWHDYLIEYYTLEGLFGSATGRPLLCKVPDGTVLLTNDVMYVPQGNPLLDRINEIISRVFEAGLYSNWYASIKNKLKVEARAIRIPSLANEYCDLNMEHMQSAFYILLLGYMLSIALFLVELSRKFI